MLSLMRWVKRYHFRQVISCCWIQAFLLYQMKTVSLNLCNYNYNYLRLFTEMDYWRSPSRKLFAAKGAEYSDLSRKIVRNRKHLSRKRASDSGDDDLLEEQLAQMESKIDSVSLNFYNTTMQLCL